MPNATFDMGPSSGSRVIVDSARAEVYCESAGHVVEERLIESAAQLRAFEGSDREDSHAGPPGLPGSSLMTFIRASKDARGKSLTNGAGQRAFRLPPAQHREAARKDRSQRDLAARIWNLGMRVGVDESIRDRAAQTARKAPGYSRGRSFDILAAVFLLMAARAREGSLRADDLVTAIDGKKGTRNYIFRLFRKLNRETGLGIAPANPALYVPRLCSELKLPMEAQTLAVQLLKNANAIGRSPTVLAAGAVYAACQELGINMPQKAIAKAIGVSEV